MRIFKNPNNRYWLKFYAKKFRFVLYLGIFLLVMRLSWYDEPGRLLENPRFYVGVLSIILVSGILYCFWMKKRFQKRLRRRGVSRGEFERYSDEEKDEFLKDIQHKI